MYEVWEVFEHDACIEPVALIGKYSDLFSATAVAVQCRRPGIEVKKTGGPWLSHLCNPDGSWKRAFGPKV